MPIALVGWQEVYLVQFRFYGLRLLLEHLGIDVVCNDGLASPKWPDPGPTI